MAYKNSWTNSTPADPCTVTIAPDADDFLIGWAITDSTSGADEDPSGWTRAFRDSSTFDNAVLLVCYKKATGAETSAAFGSVGSNQMIAGVASFSDIDTTTPLDVTPVTFTSSTSATTTSISITPVTNGCDLVFVQGQDGASSDYSFTFSTTSGTTGAWTTQVDQNSGFMNVAMGSATQTTAGALTAQVVTTTGGRLGILFALRPASAAATATTLSGPTVGMVGIPGTYTVGADGAITGTVTVTPSDGGGGGTFSPTSVDISSGTPTATFTYTNPTIGSYTISTTNNGGLSNPSSISLLLVVNLVSQVLTTGLRYS